MLYLPLKAAFAIGGGIVGGLAYAFSGGNENAAKSIWTTSLYGTYIITPDHLRGDRPIRFLGVPETEAPLAPFPLKSASLAARAVTASRAPVAKPLACPSARGKVCCAWACGATTCWAPAPVGLASVNA